jgi:1-deoxy-D-xylulose-5-phosphate synthase
MYTAAKNDKGGVFVIRYPRGKGEKKDWRNTLQLMPIGKGVCLRKGKRTAVLSIGPIGNEVVKALRILGDSTEAAHYDMIFLKPVDEEILHEAGRNYENIITVENGVRNGGLGSAVAEFMEDNGYTPHLFRIGLPDAFVPHGSIAELNKIYGLDAESIAGFIQEKERNIRQ